MSVRVNKSIIVNGQTIELVDLVNRPCDFLDLLKTQFRESTFEKKSTESYEGYLKRLFALLYGRQNKRTRQNTIIQNSINDLNLNFDIIRQNKSYAKITFKQSGNSYRINNKDLTSLIDAAKTKSSNKITKTGKLIGVELEFIGDRSKLNEFCSEMRKLVGSNNFRAPLRYFHNDGSMWILGLDGSVKTRKNDKNYRAGMTGYELTSPVLKLSSNKDMNTLRKVCDLIKSVFNGYTNRNCGTHVHMSFPVNMEDMKLTSYLKDNEFLRHFVLSYRESESSLFDKVVTLDRREGRNKYCKQANEYYMTSRYRKLNVTTFMPNTDRLHLEFRQLNGTLDADNIILWSKLQALFVDSVMKTWNDSKKANKKPSIAKLKLENIIVSNVFEFDGSERLMKMAEMIA